MLRRERRRDLRQMREIAVAQHEAQIGMRDQTAAVVDHIGKTLLADMDRADDVPDEFQIHVGDRHARRLADMGERNRHVGFGAAAELDRAEPDLVGDGAHEARIAGKILARRRSNRVRAARRRSAPCRVRRCRKAR